MGVTLSNDLKYELKCYQILYLLLFFLLDRFALFIALFVTVLE